MSIIFEINNPKLVLKGLPFIQFKMGRVVNGECDLILWIDARLHHADFTKVSLDGSDLSQNGLLGKEPDFMDIIEYECPCCHNNMIMEYWGNNVYDCSGTIISPYNLRICQSCQIYVLEQEEAEDCREGYLCRDTCRKVVYEEYCKLLSLHPIFEKEGC